MTTRRYTATAEHSIAAHVYTILHTLADSNTPNMYIYQYVVVLTARATRAQSATDTQTTCCFALRADIGGALLFAIQWGGGGMFAAGAAAAGADCRIHNPSQITHKHTQELRRAGCVRGVLNEEVGACKVSVA